MSKDLSTVVFQADDASYSMDIHDANGNRWVTSGQVGEALGNANIRDLIAGLTEKGELKEGVHICRFTLQMPGDTQPRKYLVLSYRGIIRVAMRSDGSRAKEFRDWAEDVLYEVMTTGEYVAKDVHPQPAAATSMVPVAREYKAAIQIAKLSGLTGNQALLAADRAARNFTGLSPLQIVNVTHLTCEVQEEHLIPSTIGQILGGVTARDVNKMLEKAGIIEPFRDHKNRLQWRPTEKGKSFVVLKDTGKKHGDGTPVQQMFFLKSVMGELKPGSGELKQVA